MSRRAEGFSVVVPTYGRPRQLAGCLAALARLDYPRDGYEVIVVDDGSPEPLDAVVGPVREQLDVKLLRQSNRGPAVARNAGAAAASGRLLAFTDDDCRPAAGWLRSLERRLREMPDRIVGGRTLNGLERNAFSVTSQLILEVVYAFYNDDPDEARFFASNNMAMSAELFRAIGGFDETFFRAASEDRELCDRARSMGYKLAYAADAICLHEHRLTLGSFCRQHFNYGRGALRYHRLRAQRGSGRLRDDMKFHARLLGLLREPLARLSWTRRLAVVPLLGVWQVVNAAGFFYEGARRRVG